MDLFYIILQNTPTMSRSRDQVMMPRPVRTKSARPKASRTLSLQSTVLEPTSTITTTTTDQAEMPCLTAARAAEVRLNAAAKGPDDVALVDTASVVTDNLVQHETNDMPTPSDLSWSTEAAPAAASGATLEAELLQIQPGQFSTDLDKNASRSHARAVTQRPNPCRLSPPP